MAHLTPFGKLSGKCGDFVYRNYNGKTVVCSRPGRQKKSNDPAVIARRKKFKLALSIGSALTKIPAMKSIWNQFGIKKDISAYNKMVKDFHSLIGLCDIPLTFRMGPGFGNIFVESSVFKQEDEKLTAEIEIENSDFVIENIKSVQMIMLMFLKEPVYSNMPEYKILTLSSNETKFKVNQKMKLEVAVVGDNKESFDAYDERKLFYLFAGFDDKNNLAGYSNTLSVVSGGTK